MATILLRVPVEADEGTIYEALATPDGVNGWWSNHTEGPTGLGSVMKVAFPEAPMTFDFEIVEQEPRKRVAWKTLAGPPEWSGTTIAFDIESDPEGNRSILFSQDGWRTTDESFPFIAYSWAQILPRLKSLVEEGKREPYFDF